MINFGLLPILAMQENMTSFKTLKTDIYLNLSFTCLWVPESRLFSMIRPSLILIHILVFMVTDFHGIDRACRKDVTPSVIFLRQFSNYYCNLFINHYDPRNYWWKTPWHMTGPFLVSVYSQRKSVTIFKITGRKRL